jgi:Capsular polysaccharide synthesis protein
MRYLQHRITMATEKSAGLKKYLLVLETTTNLNGTSIMRRRRRLIAFSRVCLFVGACGISLWSNVRLTKRSGILVHHRPPMANVLESTSQIILLDAVMVSGKEYENAIRRANGLNVTSMLTPHRENQHSTRISAPPPPPPPLVNKGSLSSTTSSTTTTPVFSTFSRGTATTSEVDDVLDQIFNNETDRKINSVQNTTTTVIIIPKQIFMYWDQGWDVAPPLQQLARQIAQRLNPSYQLHALDRDSIEQRSNRRRLLDDETFAKLSVQAKSDVYRTLLLYQHGGIWIDATVFVNKPLDDWLDEYINRSHTDLWGFQRTKPLPMRRPIDPFLGSWFLASPRKSRSVANILRVIMKEPHRLTKEYFWWHRIVSELAVQQEHDAISNDNSSTTTTATTTMIRRSLFSDNVLPSMSPCLQQVSSWKHSAPVVKKRSSNQFAMAFSVWKDCCRGSGDQHNTGGVNVSNVTHICAKFRCEILAVNFDLANEIEAAYNRPLNSWQLRFQTPQYQQEHAKKAAQNQYRD